VLREDGWQDFKNAHLDLLKLILYTVISGFLSIIFILIKNQKSFPCWRHTLPAVFGRGLTSWPARNRRFRSGISKPKSNHRYEFG